ncbi:acyl carrier protein [Streptomyces sp. NPDC048483]|uniref:acyl carrier protein n=1 Tax=Streptomyces sp. NPDC048483 TaxID=3154927 RepID=UPI00343E5350
MPSLYEPVKATLTRHFNIPDDTIHPATTLEDLGMDSLAMVELMCVLQDDLGLRAPDLDTLKGSRTTLAEAVTALEQAQDHPASTPAADKHPVAETAAR